MGSAEKHTIKIQREFKVLSHSWVTKFEKHHIRDDGNRGSAHWHLQTLLIDDDMHPDNVVVTYVHERLHIMDRYMLNDALDENTTAVLAEAIAPMLREWGIEFYWSEIEK